MKSTFIWMKRWLVASALLAGILLLGACAAAAAPGLENTKWKLVSFGPSATPTPVLPGADVTLQFAAGGQVTGSSGCNSFGGQYKLNGNNISFDQLISTLRACVDPNVNQQEQRYLDALNSTGKVELTTSSLKIWYDNGNSVLNLTPSQ